MITAFLLKDDDDDKRRHRSVSQYNQYQRCPYSFKLQRLDKAWSRPAAWLAQGSAVHEAAEFWENSERGLTAPFSDALECYSRSYERHINESCEITPNLDWWFASGPYGGEADIERRYHIGLDQCEKYANWYIRHPEEVIWIAPAHTDPRCAVVDQSQAIRMHPDDPEPMWVHAQNCDCRPETPGIELSFDIDLDGVLVRGFIDAVIQIDQGEDPPVVLVRDNKTGNHPGDDFQLGVYAVALSESYGIAPPEAGDYWMGRTGKPTDPFPLHEWTREKVSAAFKDLDDNIKAERFDPKPEPAKCRFCSVSYSCEFSAA